VNYWAVERQLTHQLIKKKNLGYDFQKIIKNINLHHFVGFKGGKKETKDLLTEPRVAPGCTNRASSLTTFAHQAAAALAWWQAAAYVLFVCFKCLFVCLLAESSSARGTCNLAHGVGAENQYWCQEAQKRSCGEEE
jgi:hypothetical protein